MTFRILCLTKMGRETESCLWTVFFLVPFKLLPVIATGFGVVVGVISLGMALVCVKKRSGKDSNNSLFHVKHQTFLYACLYAFPQFPKVFILQKMFPNNFIWMRISAANV